MALPPIEVDVRADTSQAEAALDRVGDQAVTAGNRVKGGTRSMAAGATAANRSFGVLGGQSRMLSQQLSQVAQQATATGQVGQALAVQAADIGLAFGTVGTIVGALVGIALPSLIQMFNSTGEEVVSAEDALDAFNSAMNRVDRAASIGVQSIGELREEYGQFAEQVQFAARVVAQAALADGMREFADVANGLQAPLSGVASALSEYERQVAILSSVQDTLGEKTVSNAAAFEQYERGVDEAREAVVSAASDIGLTVRQAELLQGVLDRMASAEGPEQIAEQAGYALEIFDAMFTTASNIPPEVAQLIAELRDVQLAASQAAENMEDMADAARALPMTSGGMAGAGLNLSDGMTGGQLLPPGEEDGSGGRGPRRGGRSIDTTEADLERLQKSLMTETEAIQSAYAERLELLRTARENELLTKQEYDELEARLEQEKADGIAQIQERAAQHEINMRAKTSDMVIGLLQNLGEKNEAFAKAAVVLNAAKAIRETMQNTAAASVRALAELGPVAGPPAAASIQTYGAVQAGIIGANAALSLGAGGGAGGGGGPSIPLGGGGGDQQAQAPQLNRSLSLIGDRFNRAQAIEIAEFMNEGSDNGLIIRGRA